MPAAAACLAACACAAVVSAQADARRGAGRAEAHRLAAVEALELERAMDAVCVERELDPRGSVPIDVMQARPSLPVRHPEAVEGAARAQRLLPEAKRLAAEALRRLAREHNLSARSLAQSLARVEAVERIRPEMELRDNASVLYREPHTIRFGTLFLAGLRSDEGVVSVLAHELTHVADGATGRLAPLFRRVAARAAHVRGVTPRRAEELTCDLVGLLAARLYIARRATPEPLARRAARAVEHNCVEHDETDREHLSPRSTMRALLALDPVFAAEVRGELTEETLAPGAAEELAPRPPRAPAPAPRAAPPARRRPGPR